MGELRKVLGIVSSYRDGYLGGRNVMDPNWVCSPIPTKTNVLTLGVMKANVAFITRPGKENWWQCSKKSELPNGFQGRIFKGKLRERVAGCVISS